MHYRESHAFFKNVFSVVKRLPEYMQADNPEVLKKLAKKLERQQVSDFNSILKLCLAFL